MIQLNAKALNGLLERARKHASHKQRMEVIAVWMEGDKSCCLTRATLPKTETWDPHSLVQLAWGEGMGGAYWGPIPTGMQTKSTHGLCVEAGVEW